MNRRLPGWFARQALVHQQRCPPVGVGKPEPQSHFRHSKQNGRNQLTDFFKTVSSLVRFTGALLAAPLEGRGPSDGATDVPMARQARELASSSSASPPAGELRRRGKSMARGFASLGPTRRLDRAVTTDDRIRGKLLVIASPYLKDGGRKMQRRNFLQTSAATLSLAAAHKLAWATVADEPKKRVGLIGTGWYGKVDLLRLIQVSPVEVVSLCDVDSQMLDEAAEIVAGRQLNKKRPRTYADYRQMLAEKDLDMVLIGTPDHWHALPMIEAVKSGVDVYVQKPTAVDVRESQAMMSAARKYERVVQVGTQRRSTPHLIEARDRVVNEGLLGDVAYAEVCCYYHMRNRSNPPPMPVPEYLDYEMWVGPAPMTEYCGLQHPRKWRAFMEYSNGIMGDMCVHMYDMVRWMLGLGWPNRISSSGGIFVQTDARATIADTQTATFSHPELDVVWNHRSWGAAPDPDYPWAAFIYGDKGTLKLDVHKYEFIPNGGGQKLSGKALYEYDKYPEDETEKDLERHVASAVRGHMIDLLENIQTRGRPVADIEQGHISSSSCILANMAMKLGRTLEWDPEKHEVVGDEEANSLLARPYRAPWPHPDPKTV